MGRRRHSRNLGTVGPAVERHKAAVVRKVRAVEAAEREIGLPLAIRMAEAGW